MYYCIDCYFGNGKDKPYPSDHVSIFGENLNEVITKFGELNKSACFECWEQVYITKWLYSFGEYEPTEPIKIHFLKSYKINIPGIGVFEFKGKKYTV